VVIDNIGFLKNKNYNPYLFIYYNFWGFVWCYQLLHPTLALLVEQRIYSKGGGEQFSVQT
jgi:hypothetical protein